MHVYTAFILFKMSKYKILKMHINKTNRQHLLCPYTVVPYCLKNVFPQPTIFTSRTMFQKY